MLHPYLEPLLCMNVQMGLDTDTPVTQLGPGYGWPGPLLVPLVPWHLTIFLDILGFFAFRAHL